MGGARQRPDDRNQGAEDCRRMVKTGGLIQKLRNAHLRNGHFEMGFGE